ncbi:MAG: hypothetical protein ACI3Y2_04940 [Candidatus Egerieousia sp.]
MKTNIKKKWEELSPSLKILIIIGIASIIGIIMRWHDVIDGLGKGFKYFSGYAD